MWLFCQMVSVQQTMGNSKSNPSLKRTRRAQRDFKRSPRPHQRKIQHPPYPQAGLRGAILAPCEYTQKQGMNSAPRGPLAPGRKK